MGRRWRKECDWKRLSFYLDFIYYFELGYLGQVTEPLSGPQRSHRQDLEIMLLGLPASQGSQENVTCYAGVKGRQVNLAIFQSRT